jgi:hypothetical protein
VGDDRAGKDDPEAAADAEDRRDQRDPLRRFLARELVADDAEGEREDRPARALNHAGEDQHPDRVGDRGDEGADRQHEQGDDERVLLPEHVAEPADDRGQHGGAQQVSGQKPGSGARRGVQVCLDRRQRRGHGRLQQRIGGPSQGQHGEGDAVVLALVSVPAIDP